MTEDLEELKRKLAEANETIRAKDQEISNLNAQVLDLRGKLDILQRQRPKLSPQNLTASFRNALAKMEEGLEIGEGRVNYVVSNLDIELKTAITLDDEGNINFQLPKVEDIIPLENLSLMTLSMKAMPKAVSPPAGTREVPTVIGLSQEKAVEVLSAAGFKVGSITEKLSNTPAKTVIAQDPERYTLAPVGIAVDLVTSKIRETKVPNLIGQSLEDALDIMAANDLLPGEISEDISDSPPGTVIHQSIEPGAVVGIGTKVDLVIAKAEMVIVPDLVGNSLEEAKRKLTRGKLKVGQVTVKSSSKPGGTVLRQEPKAGLEVSVDSQVNLVVSKPEKIKVPDLSDMRPEKAERALNQAGLKVGKIIHRRSSKPRDTVIGQSPSPGDEVEVGTLVDLTLSSH